MGCINSKQIKTVKKVLHDIHYLQTVDVFNEVPEFTEQNIEQCEEFILPVKYGTVSSVYDVDTFTIMFYLPLDGLQTKIFKKSCRISGIDGPEMRTSKKTEKQIAIKGQEYLSDMILGKVVELRNVAEDKYGRILADVYIHDNNVSEILLRKRLVVKYDGGKKKVPRNWVKYNRYGKMR
jgi:micrococcal nuclease